MTDFKYKSFNKLGHIVRPFVTPSTFFLHLWGLEVQTTWVKNLHIIQYYLLHATVVSIDPTYLCVNVSSSGGMVCVHFLVD